MVYDIAIFFAHWWPLILAAALAIGGLALCVFFKCYPYIMGFGIVLFLAFYAKGGRIDLEQRDSSDFAGGTVVEKKMVSVFRVRSDGKLIARKKCPSIKIEGRCRHGKSATRTLLVNEKDFAGLEIGNRYSGLEKTKKTEAKNAEIP